MKPLVIYHAGCWDGFCAAWIARKALGNIEAVPAHYGTPAPDCRGRDVYLLDFSYPRPVMRRILGEARWVVVLDHHKTAEAELAGIVDEFIQRPDLIATDLEANPDGSALPVVWFDMGKSGGRLAWEYFSMMGHGLYSENQPRSPWLVDYTEDRDLWRHALPDTHEINAALRSYPLDFALWDEFHDAVGQREMFKREGSAIRRIERQMVQDHVRHAREIQLDGHTIKAVNATVLFSEIAGELAKGQPFGACYFDRFDGKRQWSLRSDDNGIDVSAIAKAHGGGGHFHAAGFAQLFQPSGWGDGDGGARGGAMATAADCYEYVRSTYGVPAYIGVRVKLTWNGKEGVVVRAKSDLHYVHVRLDGQRFSVPVHPTDIEYQLAGAASGRG